MNNNSIKRILKKVKKNIAIIEQLSDEQLKQKTFEFKEKIDKGVSTNKILPEAFAVAYEADKRILGMAPYDVQIMGAIALHYCNLAEMNTGEGKTLTATLPLYLNALTGKSTMLVTANEYLADRDAHEMGPVYEFLGLTVKSGVNIDPDVQIDNEAKKEIYNADIVYTTHSTLGFDYLLNNLVKKKEDRFLREFYYVIIDEADMVLMDAAQMPLVISGVPRVQSNLYASTDFFVTTLVEDEDYVVKEKSVWLTDKGVAYAEQFFGIKGFYNAENFEINRHVTLALRAHTTMQKDKDYVVTEKGELSLLDNGTGRVLTGMKLRGGMHQAIEAKEKVKLSQENRSVASITYQNLFLLFPRLSGMSGTIADAREELKKVYKKDVSIIPPNKPLIRKDKRDLFFNRQSEQYAAAIKEVLRIHETGQPILVVTSTIADTEYVSHVLVEKGVPHSVLNANNAYWEAQIIKEAGTVGTVTVSTGMAGRGTDIKLQEGAAELGGLAVIGIGRMANIRLERQARGRAGRQGDPGTSQFFVSIEDEVVTRIDEKKVKKLIKKNKRLTRLDLRTMINGDQKLQEENAVTLRQQYVDYDKVLSRQRNIIYDVRDRLLDGQALDLSTIKSVIYENIKDFVYSNKKIEVKDINRYILNNITYSVDAKFDKYKNYRKKQLVNELTDYANKVWDKKQESFESLEEFQEYVRLCSLTAIDNAWVEQMDYMQQLQSVISGRATAQKNPVFEYYNEAYKAFKKMEKIIKQDIVRNILLGKPTYNKEGKMDVMLP